MNRRLTGGIRAAICASALAGCGAGGGGNGDSSATPSAQAKKDDVSQLKAATPQIADVGITPLSALRPGTKVNFVVSGKFPSATTYVWDFGDSSPLSNGVSAKHMYLKLATFTVKVTATDASNQKSVETRLVTIVQNQPPHISGGVVSIGANGPGNVFDTLQIGSGGAISTGRQDL
jgi:PKD repeat protein